MKVLIAPLHYKADRAEGSEYSRAYDYLQYLSEQPDISGDVLVGYLYEKKLGNLSIKSYFQVSPRYISNLKRIKFVWWLFVESIKLRLRNRYDLIWHNGPFALGETFSLISLFNYTKTPLLVGPVNMPHKYVGKDESRSMGNKNTKESSLGSKLLKHIDNQTYFLSKVFSLISISSLKKANLVLAKETSVANLLKSNGVTKVATLLTGINIVNASRSKIGATPGKVRLFNISYLVERKCTIDLIHMMDHLVNNKQRKEFELTIVGDGPQREKLELMVRMYNLQKHVIFVGFIPKKNIMKYFVDADIFVSASLSDTMPAMYYEAMSAGLPMVTYECDSANELSTLGVNIYTAPTRKYQIFADIVIRLSQDIEKLRQLGEHNHRLYADIFDFNKTMSQLKKILHRVAENK